MLLNNNKLICCLVFILMLLPHTVNCRRFCFWRRQSFGSCTKYLGNR